MRLHTLILLTVIVFHGVYFCNAQSINIPNMIDSSKGLLRSHAIEEVHDEERVDTEGLASRVAALTSRIFKSSSSPQNQVQRWMQYQFHPQELFGALRLGNAAARVDDNTNLLEWLRYIVAFRSKKGEQAFSDLDLYYLLLKTNSADELTTLFQSLNKTPGLTQLAASMQKLLSGSWVSKSLRKMENPEDVYKMLQLESAGAKLGDTPMFPQWLKYVEMYRARKGYSDWNMLHLFLKTMPEGDAVKLVHWLRQVPGMKNDADEMQNLLFLKSKNSRKFMRDTWLKAGERPEEVYKILHLEKAPMRAFSDNAKLYQWLRYIKLYRAEKYNSFSNAQLYGFLIPKKENSMNYGELGALFQMVKEVPDLKNIGEGIQFTLFKILMSKNCEPKRYLSLLEIPYPFPLKREDPRFRTLKAYTLQFAKERSGKEVLEKVKTLFANGNPEGALTAAVG
ncbi:Secreted RxLR effector peptide protein [Phytophthora palmivora]|uniref:Secreted RxLR effector peptide protein n=1 Tax=Phytophthora palmivora TaxID=4796 RepID=A0A2P4YKA8_9STRA|nr:Secreted RxLR effector peptide protein [Phytophthora palmivora]